MHNLWINSYVIESLEKKEIVWFPYDGTVMTRNENKGKDES